MVASRKIHCVICDKKCSGNVLRYQDQYYHKQCFELEQSEGSAGREQQEPEIEFTDQSLARQVTADQTQGDPYSASRSSDQIAYDSQLDSNTIIANDINRNPLKSHYFKYTPTSNQHSSVSPIEINQQRQTPLPKSTTGSISTSQPTGYSEHHISRQPIGESNHFRRAPEVNMSSSMAARGQTMDGRQGRAPGAAQQATNARSATLPHSSSSPANGFLQVQSNQSRAGRTAVANCAGCSERIRDGQALIALDLHWHVWCFKCIQCKTPLHGEYVAKDGRAYCEKDYQKLFGVTCVYCKRYITGKVLQAGEAHHFHPSCARCSKCGDPFVPGEEMYLQGEVTWHPRCGPGPDSASNGQPIADELLLADSSGRQSQLRSSRAQSPSLSSRSRSRSTSPFSYMSRKYGRSSPGYADSEAVGDLSRIYTISYLNADPTQGYLRRPIEPAPPKSPQFSRPTSATRAADRSRASSRSQYSSAGGRERSVPRGMYSVLSGMRSTGSSHRARSPSMLNEEAIHLAAYPSGQKPSPDAVPMIERDDFPAPPFPYPRSALSSKSGAGAGSSQQVENGGAVAEPRVERPAQPVQQQRSSRPRSREIVISDALDDDDDSVSGEDPQLRKEEQELSKIANGIGKIFLQTLKEREKLRAWKRANLDPRNASRTPSATRELPNRLRYDNPSAASPSRDMDRPRPWEDGQEMGGEHSPTRTRSSLGRPATGQTMSAASSTSYGYKVVQSNRSTPKPGYGLTAGPYETLQNSEMSFSQQQQRDIQNRSADLLSSSRQQNASSYLNHQDTNQLTSSTPARSLYGSASSAHFRRSMPNVANLHHLHQEGPPKLYPYHLLATCNYRLPPDVDRCHLERHLSNEEFQYIFHCDRLDFYRLPEWKRNELKRRAKLF